MRDNLERLLEERQTRLWRAKSDRQLVAAEDLVRCRQGWRRPWYRLDSVENGYPPRWLNARRRNEQWQWQ